MSDPTRPLPREFCETLRQHRLAAGLTQEELAGLSGLSARTVSDLERGRTGKPYQRTVRLLADALKLDDAQRGEFQGLSRGESGGGTELPGPRQLPAGVAQFVGREHELRALDELLGQVSQGPAGGAVVISVIAGAAGIGKTALAVHWARQASAKFPDGQLYVNLRGFGPSDTPMAAGEAVCGFLAALGVAPEAWPPGLDAQAGLYRSLIAGKRMLIVLDNARDAEQVRPLLPGTPGCLALITSRALLGGLAVGESARLLTLDALSDGEAWQLLAARLGAARVMAEPGAVSDLAKLAARLPLALAIVSARASARPNFSLAILAAELRDESARLDALDTGDPASSVRAAFSWSYDQLSPAGARLFRLLGMHPGPDFNVCAAASLARTTPAKARRSLDELARANLLTEQAPNRFGWHDLLHAYAIEQATATGSGAARRAALGRLLDYYLQTAATADRLLYPHRRRIDIIAPGPGVTPDDLASHGQALAWLDAERHGLVVAVTLAADHGFDVHAWQLAFSLETFFFRRGHWQDWAATQRTALAAACRLGDLYAQTLAHCGVANAQIPAGSLPEALNHLASALRLREEASDIPGQSRVHLYTGRVLENQKRWRDALDHNRQALQLAQSADAQDAVLLSSSLAQVGWDLARLGRYRQALRYCQQAVSISQQIGDKQYQPSVLDSLGYVYWHLGQYSDAADCYRRAVELCDELGDLYRKALAIVCTGDMHNAAGDLPAARQAWTQGLAILDDLHHPEAGRVRAELAQNRAEYATETPEAPAPGDKRDHGRGP